MDPNATLERIERLVVALGPSPDPTALYLDPEISEACDDLCGWLESGGFQPKWGDYPEAAAAYRAWEAQTFG